MIVTGFSVPSTTPRQMHRSPLISTLRRQDLVRARHIAMWLARQRYGVSLPNIGRTINRDHTTVLHGIRRAQKLMTEDRDFQRDLAEVIAYLDAPEAAQ